MDHTRAVLASARPHWDRNNHCGGSNRFAAAGRGRFSGRTLPALLCRSRGFGERVRAHSTVVDSMVKQTVNGMVQLDYIPSGVAWNLTCPAANALERNALYKNSEPWTRPALSPAHNPALRRLPAPTLH